MKKAIQISYGLSEERLLEELKRMGIMEQGGSSRYEAGKWKFTKFGTIVIEFIEE